MTISQGYETPLPEKFGLTYEFDKVVSSPLNVILRILIQLTVSSFDKYIGHEIPNLCRTPRCSRQPKTKRSLV